MLWASLLPLIGTEFGVAALKTVLILNIVGFSFVFAVICPFLYGSPIIDTVGLRFSYFVKNSNQDFYETPGGSWGLVETG